MEKQELQNISIKYYCDALRLGISTPELEEINTLLTKSLGEIASGFDLSLFMLQKDLLIFQCKFAKAYFDMDNEMQTFYNKKIEALKKQLDKKVKQIEKPNPYKSFLAWILAVEKYLCFAIDKNNDLLYFSEATKQMLNHYESQKQNIEANKVNK